MNNVEIAEEMLEAAKNDIKNKLSIENQAIVATAANLIRGICNLVDNANWQLQLGTVALALVSNEYNVKLERQASAFQAALDSCAS